MTDTARAVLDRLAELGITYELAEHAPAHTMADCMETDLRLGCVTAKNYFLTTKNQKRFYLCLVRPEARFKTADISRQAGSSRLSFAAEEHMQRLLRVYPGAVSPLGLLFDEGREVQLLVDRALADARRLAFHPCDNSLTVAMSGGDFFRRFLPALDREPLFVDIHDFLEPSSAEDSGQ